MNKTILTMISFIVIMLAILTGIIMYGTQTKNKPETIVTEIAEENILDECTDEYEALEIGVLETNSQEKKVSPNCDFILKIYYKGCNHTQSTYIKLSEEAINKTETEIEEMYSDWKVEEFDSNKIVLYQEKEGQCGEHYIVKDKEGKVIVYNILEDGTEVEYEITGISTEFLPETDKINMKNGIRVNGKQDLNQLIEDFE